MPRVKEEMADTPEMPPHIAETVQAITDLHSDHHRSATGAERFVDRVTGWIGRPAFLIALLLVVVAWIAGNVLAERAGVTPLDSPPFDLTDLVLTFTALLIAVLILTSQRRADRLAHLRQQMTLEAALMTEQRARKIVDLLEELRRDSPQVRDRHDPEAAQMATKANPRAVLDVIEESANAVVRSAERNNDKSD